MSDMAEVLRAAFTVETSGEYDATAIWATPEEVAAALSAAGFGPVVEAKAEALEEAAAHLDQPRTVWVGDGGAMVLESQTGPMKFTQLADWLRARAAELRES